MLSLRTASLVKNVLAWRKVIYAVLLKCYIHKSFLGKQYLENVYVHKSIYICIYMEGLLAENPPEWKKLPHIKHV